MDKKKFANYYHVFFPWSKEQHMRFTFDGLCFIKKCFEKKNQIRVRLIVKVHTIK